MKQVKHILLAIFLLLVVFPGTSQELNRTYTVEKVSGKVNDKYSNFGPTYYGEDKLIFSAPAKRNYVINNIWKGNGQPFLDLYVGTIKGKKITKIKNFSRTLNSRYHEGSVVFSNNKDVIYFTRNNFYEGKFRTDDKGLSRLKLFKAEKKGNGWKNVEPLPFNSDDYSVGHPALSKDGKTLYFISDMPGTLGKTDIYKVAINEDGTYGDPVNLGLSVNTQGREMFLFIDGDDLYFSTDGYTEGYGGLDVFVSKLDEEGFASNPINLGKTINSTADDFGFTLHPTKREGYFSSNREGGKGDDDIYFFKENPKNMKCTYKVIVTDMNTNELLEEAKVTFFKGKNSVVRTGRTNKEGAYEHTTFCDSLKEVQIRADKDLYKGVGVSVRDSEKNTYRIALKRVFDRKDDKIMVRVNPIYFDYDEAYIRPDAALELNKVIEVMREYPEILIESGSHTDSRGSADYNQKLSERRAKSTVSYIVARGGISADRITYRGYGKEQLVNRCKQGVRCSEREHQLNRRTEFVIVNPNVLEEASK